MRPPSEVVGRPRIPSPAGGFVPRGAPVVNPVREGRDGRVVIVHPGALDAMIHRRLAALLPDRLGVTVLDLQGLPEYVEAALSGGRVGGTTVSGLADRLAGHLAALPWADQPYVLVGWSFGGVVAHQLTCSPALRRAPAGLVLLDSISAADGYCATVEDLGEPVLLDWFEMYLAAKRSRPLGSREPGVPADLADLLQRAVRRGSLRPTTSLEGLRKAYQVFVDGLRRNTNLANPHRPARSPVPASVVRAEVSLVAEPGTLGYLDLVPPGFGVHTVPGDHYSMLDDPDAMAQVAEVCLRHFGTAAQEEEQR